MTAGRWLGRIALVFTSVVLTVGAVEVAFRLMGFSPLHDTYSKPSLLWRHDALLGWSHEPGTRETYVGPRPFPIEFRTDIRINSLGLRGGEIPAKPEGGYRILSLGDSIVAAFEVAESETFMALAEKKLRNRTGAEIEVINAGVRGYGTDQSYLYFKDRGHALDADLVVFTHSVNDFFNNVTLHRIRRPFGKSALRPNGRGALEAVGTPIESYPLCSAYSIDDDFVPVRTDRVVARVLCHLQIGLSDHSALFSAVVTRLNQNPAWIRWLNDQVIGAQPVTPVSLAGFVPFAIDAGPGRTAGDEAQRRLLAHIVGALAKEVRDSGASFLWVMSPTEQEKIDLSWPELEGLTPVALQGRSMIPPERFRFRNDQHFTPAGHRYWADLLVPQIERILYRDRPDLAPSDAPLTAR